MAEVEVNYASVVFKSSKQAPPEAKKEEETVYDEVKKTSETTEQTADTNGTAPTSAHHVGVKTCEKMSTSFLPDKKANRRRRHYQQLACGLGILCVILLSGLIAVCYFLATLSRESDITDLNQINENKTTLLAANRNLTNLNDKLSLDNDNLRRQRNNLTLLLGNLTQNYTVLESEIKTLTTQNHNLTGQIQTMKTNWNELNISRAQWSIDVYCPKENKVRKCNACLKGWEFNKPSCYVTHNGDKSYDLMTWEQARENCTGKNADLVVVQNQQEKVVLNKSSFGTYGYWIGLRAEGGKWKWIDGTELKNSSWIGAPTEGHCGVSVHNKDWTSVMCNGTQRLICKQEALTV